MKFINDYIWNNLKVKKIIGITESGINNVEV